MRRGILCLVWIVASAALASAQATVDAPVPASIDEVWLTPGESSASEGSRIIAEVAAQYSATQPIPLVCELEIKGGFHPDGTVTLVVTDDTGAVRVQETRPIKSQDSKVRFEFLCDVSALAPGIYVARMDASLRHFGPTAWCEVMVTRVTDTWLAQRNAALEARIAELAGAMRAQEAAGTANRRLALRLALAEDRRAAAGDALARQDWRTTEACLAYVARTAEAVSAGMALDTDGESLTDAGDVDLGTLRPAEGAFMASNRPVFLFGETLRDASPAMVQRLKYLGLNLAVVDLAPEQTLAADGTPVPFQAVLDPLFAEAESANLSVFVRLSPEKAGADFLVEHPEAGSAESANLATPALHDRFLRHIRAVAPYLAAQRRVRACAVANTPAFVFEDEATRLQFIEQVKTLYEDRHAVNQSWRAHLGSLDEILIGRDPAVHDYREKRAYQWDWQLFHRGLGTAFLQSIRDEIRAQAPDLPLYVTLADDVFEVDESRRGLDREALARLFDFTACTADVSSVSDYYAYDYPNQAAFCTLMRSMEPGKPVFCAEDRFSLAPGLRPETVRAIVYTAVWDAVISGVNAIALPVDGLSAETPDAFEGFATAALDVNRLAPAVLALQRAPIAVGILWSESAKVFDGGDPYLKSARFAFEGASFAGFPMRYVTESQCAAGALDGLKVLIIPETPALRNEAFAAIQSYVDAEGIIAKVGKPIPYNERGQSRQDVIPNTYRTILVRGMNLPTEYLHAMDGVLQVDPVAPAARPVNNYGHPLEGVKTRIAEWNGSTYLYVVNLRREAVYCCLSGTAASGRDLIRGRDVRFPMLLDPLDPMIIRLDAQDAASAIAAR